MKKIITAAAIAAMAAGFATAEAKFSINYRTGIDVAQHQVSDSRGNAHGTEWLSNWSQGRSTSGAFGISGSADYGGIQFETDVNTSNALKPTKYNGWINWGNFMLKSGAWDSRAVGTVTGTKGAHETIGYGDIAKPGLAQAFATKGNGKDISQQSGYAGSAKQQTTMIQYNNKDLGLEARIGYIDKDGLFTTTTKTTTTYTTTIKKGTKIDTKAISNGATSITTEEAVSATTTGKDTTKTTTSRKDFSTTNAGGREDDTGDNTFAPEAYFFELGYTIKDVGRILGTSKISQDDYAFAAFFEPKFANAKALTSLIGFTYETNLKGYKNTKGDWKALNAYALDLRAAYNLKDAGVPLVVTFLYNWTFGETYDQAKYNSGTNDRTHGVFATYAALNLKYTYSDTIAPFFSAIYGSGVWSQKTNCVYYAPSAQTQRFDDPYNFSMKFYGGVEFGNAKTAILITGIMWDSVNMMERSITGDGHQKAGQKAITIPVLMKVSF